MRYGKNPMQSARAGEDWVRLPASGRQGDAPAFPLPRPTKRELELWAREWCRPQALMWEASGQQLEVALYVRTVIEAERTSVVQTTRRAVKGEVVTTRVTKPAIKGWREVLLRMQEHLGLSQPGLARNRWLIVDDTRVADPAAQGAADRAPIPISDARERLRRLADADA